MMVNLCPVTMTTFKFNFSNKESEDVPETDEQISWLECEEVIPIRDVKDIDDLVIHARMFTCGNVEIGHVMPSEAMKAYRGENTCSILELPDKEHSDLITGKYEGGLKIWECTTDLIQYLEENSDINFENKKVLDLGCGAGILGIYALLKDSSVTFQDYNKEILECSTIPNVLLNIDDDEKNRNIKQCKFYSGDWGSFNNKLPETEIYDIILTSETIYNVSNYDKLLDLFLKRLSKDGEVYLAAKTCYFGVGGGTRQFEASIENNSQLESKVCWKSSGGIMREIIKLNKKL